MGSARSGSGRVDPRLGVWVLPRPVPAQIVSLGPPTDPRPGRGCGPGTAGRPAGPALRAAPDGQWWQQPGIRPVAVSPGGPAPQQYQLDYRASDTVTNFTTVVDDLQRSGVRNVLLVTSSDHMDRALLVGRIIAGSRHIQLTPVTVPCGPRCVPERRSKAWRDGFRAVIWVISGRDPGQWAAART